MQLSLLPGRARAGYTTFGCIWPRAAVQKDTGFILTDESGHTHSVQNTVTALYPDGSVKWTKHTVKADDLNGCIEVVPSGSFSRGSAGINIEETDDGLFVHAGHLSLRVNKNGYILLEDVRVDGILRCLSARETLIMEESTAAGGDTVVRDMKYTGVVQKAEVEEMGPLQAVIRISGIHVHEDEQRFPFIIRLYIGYDDIALRVRHTFILDGEDKALKGIGLEWDMPVEGENGNRHIAYLTENGRFHEAVNLLRTWRPRPPRGVWERQQRGEFILADTPEEKAYLDQVRGHLPAWAEYDLTQDAPGHYAITKRTGFDNVCSLDCLHGQQAGGVMAAGGVNGGLVMGIRDMRYRHPAALRVSHFDQDMLTACCWFYSPKAPAFSLHHYTQEAYDQTYYEGFPDKGADVCGVGCSGEMLISFYDGCIPSEKDLRAFALRLDKPPVYFGQPAYYHALHAFGYWGLPDTKTECGRWLEAQLDKAFAFYQGEVLRRHWTGLFDYGDFMHTYDQSRHQWCYDMGGYAWQNTELMPTMWLWLMFLRTGREDVFSVAESMTRHASETDIYHMGPLVGLGTRHNVRHWGCPCKELRVAQAANYRYYYYLTGDARTGEILDEVKDAENALYDMDPLRYFYDKAQMKAPTHVRSGPDWSALCSDWMTHWERTGDTSCLRKILTGLKDLVRTPLGLLSGTDFEFDPETCHIYYIGEMTAGSSHLQVCQGAPQIWLEMKDLLPEDKETFEGMLCRLGRFIYADEKERTALSRGLTGRRYYAYPYFAASLGAFAAQHDGDRALAGRVWDILFRALISENDVSGFEPVLLPDGNQEIPWISTNFTAQWCLNVIMALAFIPDSLPDTMAEMVNRVSHIDPVYHHNA